VVEVVEGEVVGAELEGVVKEGEEGRKNSAQDLEQLLR
jgi:hypothetical protein